jgi:membrane-associated phospholipid phosphatase
LRSLGTGAAEGLAIGREAALTIVNLRAADGASTERPYIPSALPGQWQRTPPFFRPPLTPHWRHVQPFCLTAIEPFLPAPPPALESPEYAAALNEVKLLGGKGSPVRTEEESLIAVFWSDFSYTSMPPGHWHEIAASIASERGLSLAETARMFALLGMAQADAAIVCWEAKFNWNFWRPVTAIRRADEDGNPLTVPDKDWDHFLPSPSFPAYTSGHSTFSAASGRALTRFFGTDRIPFTAGSDSLPGVYRSFESVQACVDEIGMSRIYGGVHFSFDNFEGKRTGALVGDYVSTHFLLPLEALPSITIMEFAEGAPLLRVHGRPGHAWSVEWSADLALWEPIASGVASSGGTAVRDSRVSGQTQGFYRVREEPVAR